MPYGDTESDIINRQVHNKSKQVAADRSKYMNLEAAA